MIKNLIPRFEVLQERYEQRAYLYRERYFREGKGKKEFNWGKHQKYLGMAKGIGDAIEEIVVKAGPLTKDLWRN